VGNFDGFPTGACVEAALCEVAIMATDALQQNPGFVDQQSILLLDHDGEPLPEQISAINLMDRLLSEKTKAQKDKVTAGAIKKGWIKAEGQTYRDIPVSIQTQAVAFPEKFFAAFGI
jgi:hypothetical protein